MDLKRSNGVPASALDRTWCDRAQLRSNARSKFERRSSQPASHTVALAGPMIPSLPALRRAVICVRSQGVRSNACISAIERMACVRKQPYDLAAHQFSINRPLSAF
jgi:hypothetical protein